jgi:hypothetical protein
VRVRSEGNPGDWKQRKTARLSIPLNVSPAATPSAVTRPDHDTGGTQAGISIEDGQRASEPVQPARAYTDLHGNPTPPSRWLARRPMQGELVERSL